MKYCSNKTVIIILTHFFNENIQKIYDRIRKEAPEDIDIFVHVNSTENTAHIVDIGQQPEAAFSFSSHDELIGLGYPEKCRAIASDGKPWSLPGNNDLPMLHFWRNHPGYDFYWGIEYDVHYQGNWKQLLDHFSASKADLLSTDLYAAADTPGNVLDPPLLDPEGSPVALSDMVRGFFPIHRLSSRALNAIDTAYRQGWSGHYEMAWATFMKRAGYIIEDIGGNGIYVKPENRNRFYFCTRGTWTKSPGTFVFRPVFTKALPYENTLWHPVKPPGDYVNWIGDSKDTGTLKVMSERIKPLVWGLVIRIWFKVFWRRLA